MSEDKEKVFLQDMLEAIKRVFSYTENMEYDEFVDDTKTQDAVIRNIEIIGEAAKQISDEIRCQAGHIPWKNIARMRDKLIHHYFGVNIDIVWNVVQQDLDELEKAIKEILSN